MLRSLSRTRKDLVEARVGLVNQLHAQVERVFPSAIGLFARLDSDVALAFLHRYPTQHAAAKLTTLDDANRLAILFLSLIPKLSGSSLATLRDSCSEAYCVGHSVARTWSLIRGLLPGLARRRRMAIGPARRYPGCGALVPAL